MPTGNGFTSSERLEIDKAIRNAESMSRLEFSVYVGNVDADPRDFAQQIHSAMTAPAISVLLLIDPAARRIEIVTGELVAGRLDAHDLDLAITEMRSSFAAQDLVGGVKRGVHLLAEHARKSSRVSA